MEQRHCKKCLLAQAGLEDIRERVLRQAAAISEEHRASDEKYAERLSFCTDCESLINGMCRECGCFVELRARLKESRCPAYPAKW